MSTDPTGANPQPARKTPTDKLVFRVEELCRRITRGKASAKNWSVLSQMVLRIASILLSSAGSVGLIADKASTNLPGEYGWAFWGSVTLLGFGILSQIANLLQVAERAEGSRSLAAKCEVYDTRLENVLNDDDPGTDVGIMLGEVNKLIESDQYNRVLPPMTPQLELEARKRAEYLIARNKDNWQLAVRRQKGVVVPSKERPTATPPTPEAAPEPSKDSNGDKAHET